MHQSKAEVEGKAQELAQEAGRQQQAAEQLQRELEGTRQEMEERVRQLEVGAAAMGAHRTALKAGRE